MRQTSILVINKTPHNSYNLVLLIYIFIKSILGCHINLCKELMALQLRYVIKFKET